MNEQQVIDKYSQELRPFEASVMQMIVTTDIEFQQACGLDESIRLWNKSVEDQRKSLTQPLDESKKRIMAMFKPAQDKAEQLREHLRRVILSYNQKKEADRKAEQARIDAESKAKADAIKEKAEVELFLGNANEGMELLSQSRLVEAQAPIAVNTAKVDARKFKTRWLFKIVNAKIVPREFLCVDESLVGKVVRDKEGKTNIPGIEVYSE